MSETKQPAPGTLTKAGTPKQSTTVQQKIAELSEMVAWFQGPDFTLDEAIERYKMAEALAGAIESDLKDLKNDITVLKNRFDEDTL